MADLQREPLRHVFSHRPSWVPGSQKDAETIARHNQYPNINRPVRHCLSQVNYVHDDQITSTGHLDFHAQADSRTVDDSALSPICSACLLFNPAAFLFKPPVDQASNESPAICVSGFLNK